MQRKAVQQRPHQDGSRSVEQGLVLRNRHRAALFGSCGGGGLGQWDGLLISLHMRRSSLMPHSFAKHRLLTFWKRFIAAEARGADVLLFTAHMSVDET